MTSNGSLQLAFLTPCYRPEVNRGTERVISDLATEMSSRGHQARVITSHPHSPQRRIEDSVQVVRHWRPPDGLLRRRGFEEHLTHLPFACMSIGSGNDDLVHAHFATDVLAATPWRRRRNLPIVWTYHGLPQRKTIAARRSRIRILGSALEAADRVVVSSRAAADSMNRWMGVDPTVIYPSVDLETFVPGGTRAEVPTILCAASVGDARKRVPLLIAAFQKLRRVEPRAHLLLQRPHRSLAHPLEQIEGIELFDPVSHPAEMTQLYQRAWVSALPAYDEAFGLVLAEALACGTPVVGTQDGGIPEIVSDAGVGRLFPRDCDEDDLVRALIGALELASDSSISSTCRARAAFFSRDRLGNAHEQLYREAIGAGHVK